MDFKPSVGDPGRENTLAPANPKCGLRSWTSLNDVGHAAVEAQAKLVREVTTAVSFAATAIAALDSGIGKCILDLSVGEIIGNIGDDKARIAATAAWSSVKRRSGRDIAKDVAVSELIRELERQNPEVATALKAVGFVSCLRSR